MLLKRISNFYWHHIASPLSYAKHIGVKVGEKCLIATYGFSTEPYLITIGNNVQLTKGVLLHTHGGGNAIRYKKKSFDVFGKIVIKDWAYIGANSQIMPGVTIGEGAIVAAGSIVTKSVADHTVVGGNPAKFICTIDDYINKNEKYNCNTKGLPPIEKKKRLMAMPDSFFITK